jgi:Zn-dependent protease
MHHSVGTWIMWGGMAAWILWAIAMSWPAHRLRRLRLSATIAAPADLVWRAYRLDCHDEISARLHPTIVSVKRVQQDPPVDEYVIESRGGHDPSRNTIQYETLQERANECHRARILSCNGAAFPFGQDHTETLTLQPQGTGTALTMTWQGETATLWQFVHVRRTYRYFLHRLQRFCETGEVLPPTPQQRSGRFNTLLSILAVGTFVLWLGWLGGLILAAALILHEFGHWLAMRLTGQPAPRMMLVPFFGGIALANHPHRSLFADGFCALMGPGLSALVSLAFLIATQVLGAGLAPDLPPDIYSLDIAREWWTPVRWLFGAALIVGILNLVQLIPILPLDGGQVLRALMQSFHAFWARRAMIGLSGLGTVVFALLGDPLLAGVVAFGGLQAWHMSRAPARARPMRALEVTTIAAGYSLVAALHAAAAITAAMWLGFDLNRFGLS